MSSLDRRRFLQASAALGGTLIASGIGRAARAAPALGCDPHAYMNHHFTAEELTGKPQPDQHWHEHATCFRLGERGLGVISSCGHAGIINTLRRAQEVSGVEKIYALVGGFHLAPAPEDYLRQVMAELKKFDLDHVLPMHCSGQNFIDLAKQEMPEKLVLCTTGSRFTFMT
jgi:7,8-dihydropterin-6-yl-methyl-4-(beta-D-ribofuranosyl)aminobenzene 5'-phosphate synthase